mmetsp:Transcript_30057/g.47769  ORF Transcript_30057/g.47769 Transcript_30057/m.47769 type:complete len:215 (+) Transcript_30057:44-688(+)|eukprot:CAMPEP_0203754918 /NCGR_PEP_ID=MMETSP0098-20131031/8459_1 /ASSEMBLY_ACC=CAM_ASM_000208 /TAXON_ID=96639 /ORGANISM=" , Strain NY0313808BC1" /LENGTH=214 /DNA_ID=CAMNT_0050646163 /DNA_START=665 /DNA_END=1309 /DNA_ORIENTATION=+
MTMRQKALRGNMDNYRCCQGYFTLCSCCTPGNMGEQSCPWFCLCLEAWFCNACAISATRFHIMDQYSIVSDPCDNRIIRFNNFMQCLSFILSMLSICISELRDAAFIVEIIAKIVYYLTVGCMTAQMHTELEFRAGNSLTNSGQAPQQLEMQREAPAYQQPPPVPTPVPAPAPSREQYQQQQYQQQQQQYQQQQGAYQENLPVVDAKAVVVSQH